MLFSIKKLILIFSSICLCLILVSCAPSSKTKGRLIIWHTWNEAEAPIIEQLLADFHRLNPNINLSIERKSYDTVLDEFANASRAGLGPDVLIGLESVFAHLLYENGLVANLNESAIDWTVFDSSTLNSVQQGPDVRVGVPLNAYVNVLFYNRSLIEQPPDTLDALQVASENGVRVGLPTTFFSSYWGITAMGGSVFTDDHLSDDSQASIANWLTWLTTIQQTPGAVLSPDIRALSDGFVRGDLALLVADSLELASFITQLGTDQVGIAVIPGYPEAQPFSNVELIVVNSASVQQETAVLLSNFLTNEAQQRKLARSSSGRAPVNQNVTLNPILFPQISSIFQQNQTAVVPTTKQDALLNQLIVAADPIYQQVLEGIITPIAGAEQIINAISHEDGQ